MFENWFLYNLEKKKAWSKIEKIQTEIDGIPMSDAELQSQPDVFKSLITI